MEKLFNTSKSIHDKAIKVLIKSLKKEKINKIIDAGSGKVSASIMLKYFPNAKVDAVVYPGDNRKINPIETTISSKRLKVIEMDFCKEKVKNKYDLSLMLLTLGEALNFGNTFESLFHGLMDIDSRYFILYDVLEDPSVHYRYIEQYLKEKGFKILMKKKFRNPHPEHYPKVKFDKYKLEYDTKHYIGYLIKKL